MAVSCISIASGKPFKVAITTIMRKITTTANALFRFQKELTQIVVQGLWTIKVRALDQVIDD